MEKMDMKSGNMVEENIQKMKELFPNCVTETLVNGKPTWTVDFEKLKLELSADIGEEKKERYVMSWPGKAEAVMRANSTTTNTLRPNVKSSKDFWNTKNLYIEGNNFEVLKVLRETYLNKIGVIYIDPPYNTGRNILYKNDFSVDQDSFSLINNDVDEEGNTLTVNRRSDGRFHTTWLNMIYPVLRIARDLLTDEGFIVLAIDDNEYANLKKLCDEVFYEGNYVGTIINRGNPQGRGKKNIDPIHEYHIVFAKNIEKLPELKVKKRGGGEVEYWNFIRGGSNSRKFERPYRFYPMLVKGEDVFMITKEEYDKIYSAKTGFNTPHMEGLQKKYEELGYTVVWPISSTGEEKVWQRMFDRALAEHKTYKYIGKQIKYPVQEYSTPRSIWHEDIHSNVHYGTGYLNKLFDGKDVFDFPKSIHTVEDLISCVPSEYVMDFFAGSATTADAVMRLNAKEQDDVRKFIMIQLPENLDENLAMVNKDEQKSLLNAIALCEEMGVPHTIAEVAKERIRRAGEAIKLGVRSEELGVKNEENNHSPLNTPHSPLPTPHSPLDVGFRVLKLDSSNMQDVYYNPAVMQQSLLDEAVDNVKADRTPLDLLFQVMLDLGIELCAKIEEKQAGGKTYYVVNDNHLIACFDEDIDNAVITELAKQQPMYAVFKGASFATDNASINNEQLFKTYSPSTAIKVI